MPLYEYKCLNCGRHTEKIENVSGPHLKKCPHCKGKVESVITAPSIQFKGSGWYVTDYAGRSKSGDDGAPADKAASDKKESTPGKDGSSKESSTTEKSTTDFSSEESSSKDSKESGAKESKKTAKKK